jgi:hypothetical protein
MSWKTYEPQVPLSGAKKLTIPVTVSLNGQGRYNSGRLRLKVLVRTELLEGGLAWWKGSAGVSLLVGEDENAGSIKIVPGNSLRLRASGGRGSRALLVVPAWPGLSNVAFKPLAVEFDHADKWIEITLPSRALARESDTPTPTPTPAAGAPGPTAAASPLIGDKPGKPFTGLGSTGPHPHPAMQRPATRTPRS